MEARSTRPISIVGGASGLRGCEWRGLGGRDLRFLWLVCTKWPGIGRGSYKEKSFWSVEAVVGCVGDSEFFAGLGCVAAACWGFVAFGVDALDGCYMGESPFAFSAYYRY